MNKIGVLILLLTCYAQNGFSQWHIMNGTPNLFAVDFINDSTGLVVHDMIDGSYILKTVDYGVTWDTVASYTPSYFFDDVVFASESVAYACGGPHLFLKSIDAGETWFDPSVGQDPYFTDLFFINDTLGYASHGDGGGRLGVTMDGGMSWLLYEEGGARDLQCIANCECFATTSSRIYSTIDCGLNWPCDTIDYLNRDVNTLWFHDSNYFFLGARGGFGTYFDFNFGSIRRTYDGGETFYILDIPYTSSVEDLFFIDEQTGYAGCSPFEPYQYSILKTTDGGDTWGYQEIDMNPLFDQYTGIHEIDCPSPGYCYAVGAGIYRTTNGGGEIHDAWVEVGTNESPKKKEIVDVYPNPAASFIRISSQSINISHVIIIDLSGRKIHEASSNKKEVIIDISIMASGYYIARIELENGETIIKHLVKE